MKVLLFVTDPQEKVYFLETGVFATLSESTQKCEDSQYSYQTILKCFDNMQATCQPLSGYLFVFPFLLSASDALPKKKERTRKTNHSTFI